MMALPPIAEAFMRKIEEAVVMVEAMNTEEQNRAICFWNQISERLQEIINETAQNANTQLPYHLDADKLPDYIDATQLVEMDMINRYQMTSENEILSPPQQTALSPRDVHLDEDDGSLIPDCEVSLSRLETDFQDQSPIVSPQDQTGGERMPESVTVTLEMEETIPGYKIPTSSAVSLDEAGLKGSQQTVHMLIATDREFALAQLSLEKSTRKSRLKGEENIECQVCMRTFSTDTALRSHMRSHVKPYKCSTCSNAFSNRGNLLVHQRRHSGERPYVCPDCSMSFAVKGNLLRHIRSHSGNKPWKCDECSSCFTEKKSLRVHLRTHTGERPYKCDLCNKTFTQSGILKTHKAIHSDSRAFKCRHCDHAFNQKSQLTVHEQRHSGERNFVCTFCDSKFLTKGDLTRHTRIHTGERPYACEECSRTFNRLQSLREHMNRHSGRRPYKCKHCSKDFMEMSACYKHMKSHNRSKPSRARVKVSEIKSLDVNSQNPSLEQTNQQGGADCCEGDIVVTLANYQDTRIKATEKDLLQDIEHVNVDLSAINLLANASTFQH